MTAPLLRAPVGVRVAEPGDRARVAAFVLGHRDATPFHTPEWGEAVARGCGQRAVTLLAERGDGSIAGVLPLTHVRSPLFGQALVSCGFAVDGGVLGEAVEELASGARALAAELGCPSVELRGGAAPAEWDVDAATYLGFARDLAADDEAELLAIPRKQRAEVRKALAADLTVDIGDAAAHYRVYAESVRNLGTPVFPRALFRAVLATMDADVLTVRHRGQAVASVLSLYWRGTVYPYWGGGTQAARALRANDRMYFALMAHARARGCTRFDFGRSKAGTGAAAFKKNWGFEGVPRAYASWSEGAARAVNPLNPKYALMVRAWQRLPLPVANLLGPWISRGLGVSDILFLAHRVPFPPDRGDRIRSFHVLRHLAARARVHLVAFADGAADVAVPPAFRALLGECVVVERTKSRGRALVEALASGRPVSLTAFDDARVHDAVAGVMARQPIDCAYAFSGQMAQYLPEGVRRVMDFVDADSAKFAAYATGPLAWVMRREARLLGDYERDVASGVDAALFVSAAEAALVPGGGVLENGIDTARFDPAAAFVPVMGQGRLVTFTGQMDYRPNVEAVVRFAREMLPVVRARHGDVRFAIVGRAPTAAVRALAGRDVIVTGEVPDVRGWLAASAAVVAPLMLARGVQNKVLEAMAMARPVVASSAAAEGIDHAGTIRVDDGAGAVCALLDDPDAAAALARAARARVIARYGWAAALAPLDGIVGLDRARVAA